MGCCPGAGLLKTFNIGARTRELEYMVKWGMTSSQAIMAGTLNAVKTIGVDSQLGSIEQGKHTDLLV